MIAGRLAFLALALAAGERFREPVALANVPGTDAVHVACADGRLVRVVGTEITASWHVGASLSDVIALDDGRTLAVSDIGAGAVLLVRSDDGSVVGRARASAPTNLAQAGETLVAASSEVRGLGVWDLERVAEGLRLADRAPARLALPFEPGELLALEPRGRLVAAGARDGHLALVDAPGRRVLAVRELPAHNVRGLALAGADRLLVAHQILDPLGSTSLDDVHWGNVVRNVVREVSLSDLLEGPDDLARRTRLVHLGAAGAGAGDPSALLVGPRGGWALTLAGTDELALVDPRARSERRTPVGRRPVDLLSPDGGRTLVVASSLDARLAVVDLESGVISTLTLGPPATGAAARGRRGFYDARLSHDGWMSCHSCHPDGRGLDLVADTLGDGTHGTPKRVPALLGVGETAPFAWSGAQPTLEAQIAKTLRDTMHSEDVSDDTAADLAAFLRSLPAPTPREPLADGEAVARGRALFAARSCTDCHVPPLYTSSEVFDVGVHDEAGLVEFNPPSLRGVGWRARLFHDGRYRSLEDLLAGAGHPDGESLDAAQTADVAAFLRTL